MGELLGLLIIFVFVSCFGNVCCLLLLCFSNFFYIAFCLDTTISYSRRYPVWNLPHCPVQKLYLRK